MVKCEKIGDNTYKFSLKKDSITISTYGSKELNTKEAIRKIKNRLNSEKTLKGAVVSALHIDTQLGFSIDDIVENRNYKYELCNWYGNGKDGYYKIEEFYMTFIVLCNICDGVSDIAFDGTRGECEDYIDSKINNTKE